MATRPRRLPEQPVPPLPEVDPSDAERASTEYSHYRTGLSHHRTELSEHRTTLSEYRTDLSMHRTDLSEGRTELSMRRTGMSYHRTRLSADRTMMSIIRTALSLIGFGFTIFQFFSHLRSANLMDVPGHAPRNFGTILVAIGIVLLALGIVYHVRFMLGLRHERQGMKQAALLHADSPFPVSLPLITAVLLLLLGLLAIASMVFDIATLG
ncbi:YidH family protein [Lysobacter soli]|uniref:YidH family protein n=1 Tax=Lysobacter soli TaxID=453783 RepID=UPI0037CB8B78